MVENIKLYTSVPVLHLFIFPFPDLMSDFPQSAWISKAAYLALWLQPPAKIKTIETVALFGNDK